MIFSLGDIPAVADLRGYGMIAGIDIVAEGAPGARGHKFQKKLFDNGHALEGHRRLRHRGAAADRRPLARRYDGGILRKTLQAL